MNQQEIQEFVCQCLTPYSNFDKEKKLSELLQAGGIDWGKVIHLASSHLVIPALYASLKRKQLLPLLSAELQQYFHTLHSCNVQRNQAIQKQADELLTSLSAVNIHPVLLKGAAGLSTGLYQGGGERVMRDLDILLERKSIHPAVRQLFSKGYNYCENDVLPAPPIDEHENPIEALNKRGLGYMHHIYPMAQPESIASVELHIQPTLQLESTPILTSEEAIGESVYCPNSGARILRMEHRLLHNFYHAQIQDRNGQLGKINLTQLYEFVQLIFRHQQEVNWNIIQVRIEACGLTKYFQAYMQYAVDYFDCPLPDKLTISPKPNLSVKRHRILAKYSSLRSIDSAVLFVVLSLAREFSPIRVREMYGEKPIILAYSILMVTLPFRLIQPGTLKTTWRQLEDILRS
ncbi:MAG: hypothetical protein ACJA09_003351 [Alcanivorax sp.]|jgi:hypothetical protein